MERKRGRPKVKNREKRLMRETVLLSLNEEEYLEEAKLLTGMSKSELFRQALNLYYMTYVLPSKK